MANQEEQSYEKRAHPRYPCNFSVKIITENGEFDGTAVNISLSGILVESNQFPDFNSAIKLCFRLPTMAADIEVIAEVRWNVENVFGLRFSSLLDKKVWEVNQFFENNDG
ncbi:putative PilZ domain-containing protein [Gammaproteobacteria bacterium]